jgi:hypothetical protein
VLDRLLRVLDLVTGKDAVELEYHAVESGARGHPH